jgi:hypothetical protein
MIITAHQPLYMPWLGFFHKALLVDTICILDEVQFADRDFIHRSKIKTAQGSKWLTVPVNKKNHYDKKINQIEIVGDTWQNHHLFLLRQSYGKTPFFSSYFNELCELFEGIKYQYLIDLDMALLNFLFRELSISATIVMSSKLQLQGRKSDLILSICQELQADVYISGQNGLDYLKLEDFRSVETQVVVQSYNHPTYSQLYGDFLPYLSVLDLIFNYGPRAREIIMKGNAKTWENLIVA